MKCPDENMLEMLLNGMLSGAEAEAIEKHLEECIQCRSLFDELKSVDDILRIAAPVPAAEYWKSLPQCLKGKGAGETKPKVSILPTILTKIFWALTEVAAALIVVSTISLFSTLKNAKPMPTGIAETRGMRQYSDAEKGKVPNKNSMIKRIKELTEGGAKI